MRFVLLATSALAVTAPALAGPPPAPAGYVWEKQDAFSDEFDGAELDESKWRREHPFWRGRRPARFNGDTVSVVDGKMQIRNRMLDKPWRGFTMASGAVTSRSEEAFYGYYEVRMKASSVNLSSTFWLTNRNRRGTHQEIDVVEAVGGDPVYPDFRLAMKSNSHTFLSGRKTLSRGGSTPLKGPADEAFYTYGVWWKDANTLEMYYEGELAFVIHPRTDASETPFDRPMFMCLVTEAYDWQPVPTAEELADDAKNTTYYDWVRSYRLVPADGSE